MRIKKLFLQNVRAASFDIEFGASLRSSEYLAIAFAEERRMQDGDLYYCAGSKLYSGALQQQHMPPVTDLRLPVSW